MFLLVYVSSLIICLAGAVVLHYYVEPREPLTLGMAVTLAFITLTPGVNTLGAVWVVAIAIHDWEGWSKVLLK